MIVLAGEAFLALIGIIAYLLYFYLKTEGHWKKLILEAKEKISEIRGIEGRYEQAKVNLQKYMAEIENLKQQLQNAQTDPALTETISSLEKRLHDAQTRAEQAAIFQSNLSKEFEELKTFHDEMIELGIRSPSQIEILQRENDQLRQEEQLPDVASQSEGQVLFSQDFNSSSDTTHEELTQLKQTNREQKHLISELRLALASGELLPGDDDNLALKGLEQMLDESDAAVMRLEQELDSMRAQVDEYERKIQELMDAGSIHEEAVSDQLAPYPGEQEGPNKLIHSDGVELFTENMGRPDTLEDADDILFDVDSLIPDPLDPDSSQQDASVTSIEEAELEQLMEQLELSNKMVTNMMQVNGDQSNIVSFARNSIHCHTIEELADAMFGTVSRFGLVAGIQFRSHTGDVTTPQDTITQHSLSKLSDMGSDARFEQEGNELLVRFEHVSLLLKDMPVGDPDTMGRVKDALATIMEFANAEVKNIEDEVNMQKQDLALKRVIKTTHKTIAHFEKQFKEHSDENKDIIDNMSYILGSDTFVNAISGTHRQVYKGIMKETERRLQKLHFKGLDVNKSFTTVLDMLSKRIHD